MKKLLTFILIIVLFIPKLIYLIIKNLIPEKVLGFNIGWDTLPHFSPYSYGGISRKNFLKLRKRMLDGEKITHDELTMTEYGSSNPTKEQWQKTFKRKDLVCFLFKL